MRFVRIYQPGTYSVGETIELSSSASQHVGVVLRKPVGDSLILFCGDDREFSAEIVAVEKKKVLVRLKRVATVSRESPLSIELAQAISKGDRMEWVVQKAVELGVRSIVPLITRHCAVKLDSARLEKKRTQWQSIAISACEQSGRNVVPKVESVISMDAYLSSCQASTRLILDPTASIGLSQSAVMGDVALIIGPEGGLSEQEIVTAQTQRFQAVSLGPRIFRTETAAVVALSVLQAGFGDL